ncbi:hypothetical protein ACIQPP_05325 [Streptomyces violaceusniger]|uniref:hypothetical protein n=1 Tax=Streptomyces violaceusniger TaxID=68280 RepID=UPI000996E108|nr:hypothetical protein [Streptomyces hygroscopicus]AQW55242.1 hypothetical protein SHXM_08705 [Streptomyces hygroscopicus]
MSAKPTEPPSLDNYRKTSDNRHAVEAMLGYLSLPAPTLVPRADAVHVTVTDVDDLGAWVCALGGGVHRGPSTDGAALWTLHTATPTRRDGSKVKIRVHVAVVDGDDVLARVRRAVSA